MIEAIAILAIGATILLYADNLNEDDKRENQQLLDDYHFEKIVRELRSEDEYAQFEPDEIIEEKARAKFKSIYGYEYRKG